MGAIPLKFEPILQGIIPNTSTDWLLTQIHRAILSYKVSIWITPDILYTRQVEELDTEDDFNNQFDKDLEISFDL